MKQKIKKLIPVSLLPTAREIYLFLKYFPKQFLPKPAFNKYDAQTVLKVIVGYNEYGGYCVPISSSHRPAAKKILSNDVYEPQTIEFMLSNCGEGDVIHAGTYFGDFLPALSAGCSSNAKIWAFEPNPENYLCAKITLEINHISNVVLSNSGLGSEQKTIYMKTTEKDGQALGGGSQILDKSVEKEDGVVTINLVKVDDAVDSKRMISIIQLDVEGHEKEALVGALETIQRCLPIIIIEVWPKSTLLESQWFKKNILSLGYRKMQDVHQNSIFECE